MKYPTYDKTVVEVRQFINALKAKKNREGKRFVIIFTNGCFDILHPGHIHLLEQIKVNYPNSFLLVGINSDESIRELKGDSRPINNLDFRCKMLAALECVDAVIPFNDTSPYSLICEVMPDVLVKGNEYGSVEKPLIGESFIKSAGGEVLTIEMLPEYSTTDIIKKIVLKYIHL